MKNQKLITSLQECVRHCWHCADACLEEDDLKKMVECIRLDRECAEICDLTAKLLAINGSKAATMVKTCEAICRQCAEECDKHDMQHCQDCAEACRECVKACESYAA